tara:strand:- start:259 stop:492 length:234 start_codon:yes stop_codon:yes gene_type:complete
MEFYEIGEDGVAYPGEYVFHVPSRSVVLCGAFNRKEDVIRAMTNGRMLVDKIKNFQKIKVAPKEWGAKAGGCTGCRK